VQLSSLVCLSHRGFQPQSSFCFYTSLVLSSSDLSSVSKSCLANLIMFGYSEQYRLQYEVMKHCSLRTNIHVRRPVYNVDGKCV
jgi:hypothetical protein